MEKYYKDKELLLKIKEAKKEVESLEEAFIKAQNKELNLISKLDSKDVDDSIIGEYFVDITDPCSAISYVRFCRNNEICTTVYDFDVNDNLKTVYTKKISMEDFFFGNYRKCNEYELHKVLTA